MKDFSEWISVRLACSSLVGQLGERAWSHNSAITDEIWYPPPRPPVLGIMGGAGSWAALGARLFRKPPSSVLVGWVVHRGSDFPRELEQEICSWQTRCNFIRTPERLTTRGLNHYTNEEHRGRHLQLIEGPNMG